MAGRAEHGSAKIYQFPLKPTAAQNGKAAQAAFQADVRRIASTPVDDCWYHQAAVQNERRETKR